MTSTNPPVKRKRKTTKTTLIPDDFELNELTKKWAKKREFDAALINRCLIDFQAYYSENQEKKKSWQAAFQSWVNNEVRWHPEKLNPQENKRAAFKTYTAPPRINKAKRTKPVSE